MWRRANDWIAVHATLAFGSMWATYVFFLYGFAPIMWPKSLVTLLYWSNTVQLWSLPLLMVGQNVLGRAGERRDQEQFRMTQQIDQLTQEQAVMMGAQRAMLDALTALSEEMLRVLLAVADKAAEIDAEVDALTAAEQQARTLLASGGADE